MKLRERLTIPAAQHSADETDQCTRERLVELVAFTKESNARETRVQFDVNSPQELATLAKDIFAMSNTSGGHIIIGVSPSGEVVGLPADYTLDASELMAKLRKYTRGIVRLSVGVFDLYTTELPIQSEQGRPTGAPSLSESQRFAVPRSNVYMPAERHVASIESPIRILHLSDLHIEAGADAAVLLQPLVQDIRDPTDGPNVGGIDYLVVSGDLTNQATPNEFIAAREFLSNLMSEFEIPPQNTMIVPGNHDQCWDPPTYDWKPKRFVDTSRLAAGSWVAQGDGFLIRDEGRYPKRFENFATHLYTPLLKTSYPADPTSQGSSILSSDGRLQFLLLNSAWEIDEYHRNRASIHIGAITRALESTEKAFRSASSAEIIPRGAKPIRIAIWHHPISGNEKITDDAFLELLAKADFRICMHGHVHEIRADILRPLHPTRRIQVIGAGSFGAPAKDRPESTPCLYNIIEIRANSGTARVHTRKRERRGGSFSGHAVWPGPTSSSNLTYYEVQLGDHGWNIPRTSTEAIESVPGTMSASAQRKRLALVYVAPSSDFPILTSTSAIFQGTVRPNAVFREHEVYVRRNSSTTTADQADLDHLFQSFRFSSQESTAYRPSLLDNLPPREDFTANFIGRRRELLVLGDWFNDVKSHRWMLVGDGGKGKSALAYEFALRVVLDAPTKFAAVIWLSAKKKLFVEGTTRDVPRPDFFDKESLADAILEFYSANAVERSMPVEERLEYCEKYLSELPALLIADDVDSLDSSNEDAIEFLTQVSARTHSKVLFTTRRVIFGMNPHSTQILGLPQQEAVELALAHVQTMGLDSKAFSQDRLRRIFEVTEGSPLYIEDIVRLCAVCPVETAIKAWIGKTGDASREYALRREFEQLTSVARRIVYACCCFDRAVSLVEICTSVNMDRALVAGELGAIQRVFLVSKPRVVDGEERFDVNVNTRSLVLRVFSNSNEMKVIKASVRDMVDAARGGHASPEVAEVFRQTLALLRSSCFLEAEQVIENALKSKPGNGDLTSLLASVYLQWEPLPRITDARDQYRRAAHLGCRKEEAYSRWCAWELKNSEWEIAVEAAELGCRNVKTPSLQFHLGYARSRLGQSLRRSMMQEKSKETLLRAEKELNEALDMHGASFASPETLSRIYRAITLNYEAMSNGKAVERTIRQWGQRIPKDPMLKDMREQMAQKMGIRFD